MPTDRAWTQRPSGVKSCSSLVPQAGGASRAHQTDGPGSQVQEAAEQVQGSQTMDLAQENLREQRSMVKHVTRKPGGRRQREEEAGQQERDLWRNRWLPRHYR